LLNLSLGDHIHRWTCKSVPIAHYTPSHQNQAVYRLTLDPLAKFPGPKINAISPLPGIRALLKGRLAFKNKLLHDKYGPVVRVSPTELHFNSVQAWEDIYGHRPGHPNFHKDPVHVGSVEPVVGVSTLTMADDANHARQRRALAHSFSQKALVDQEDIIQGYVNMYINHMKRLASNNESFNMVNWLNFTTFDIIGVSYTRILQYQVPNPSQGYNC